MSKAKTKPHVVTDPHIPEDRLILEGIDTSVEPLFTVSELAKVFFGRSAHWVRWLEEQQAFVLDGDPNCAHVKIVKKLRAVPVLDKEGEETFDAAGVKITEDKMVPVQVGNYDTKGRCKKCKGQKVGDRRTASGNRVYALSDVELISHALAQNGNITGTQLRLSLSLVEMSARVWEYL